MIHEFAVDPAFLSDWEKCRCVIENFGFHKGRVIARYPKKWKAMVLTALTSLNLSDIQLTRISVKLDEIMVTRKSEWNPQTAWLDNAEQEHKRHAFQAILSTTNPRNHTHVLCHQDLDEDTPHWAVPSQRVIPRQHEAMLATLAPIFRIAKKLVFIDPYLSTSWAVKSKALKAYLKYFKNLDNYPEIQFHTCDQGNLTFENDCKQFETLIPQGKKITFIYWQGQTGADNLHNRYLLTERGGVSFGWGVLDSKTGETDDVTLMTPTVYQHRWEQYCGTTPAFTKPLEFYINGIA